MSDAPLIQVRDLHKSFGTLEVLRGVSFDVKRGEVLAIIGPSGSGKSTLLRCLNFLEEYQAGDVLFDNALVGYRKSAAGRRKLDSERNIRRIRARCHQQNEHFLAVWSRAQLPAELDPALSG